MRRIKKSISVMLSTIMILIMGISANVKATTVTGQDVVNEARRYLEVPYVWGGKNPSTGFDCSGFTSYVYGQLGIKIPGWVDSTAASQSGVGTKISSINDLKPGDLVITYDYGHVGIYVGNGKYINSPQPGDYVREMPVPVSSFNEGRRIVSSYNTSNITDFQAIGNKAVNNSITLKGTATPSSDTLYKFYVCDRSTEKWIDLTQFSAENQVNWTPTKPGKYTVVLHVKHKSSPTTTQDDYRSMDLDITYSSAINDFQAIGSKIVNDAITLKGTATPSSDTLYKFYVCDRSTEKWTDLTQFSAENQVNWTPTKTGKYTVVLHVKHKLSPTTTQDDYRSIDLDITDPVSSITDLQAIGNKAVNNAITLKGTATPASDTLYKFYVCDRSTEKWTDLTQFSAENQINWTPTKPGKYTVVLHVKHKLSPTTTQDDYRSIDLDIAYSSAKLTDFTLSGDRIVNSTLTLKASATPANETLYKFYVCDRSTEEWTDLTQFSTQNQVNWKPTKPGKYTVVVHAKSKYSNETVEDDYKSIDVVVNNYSPSKLSEFNIKGNNTANSVITMSAKASPSDQTLYKFWVCDRSTETWIDLTGYTTNSQVTWKPTKPGDYTLVVHVKNKYSNTETQDDYRGIDINIK